MKLVKSEAFLLLGSVRRPERLVSFVNIGMSEFNCPIDFKICMAIPVVVRYDLESVATL